VAFVATPKSFANQPSTTISVRCILIATITTAVPPFNMTTSVALLMLLPLLLLLLPLLAMDVLSLLLFESSFS